MTTKTHRLRNLITVAVAVSTSTLFAQFTDEVVLQGSAASSRVTMRCQVKEYTGKWIDVLTKAGSGEKRFPASEVVSVKTYETVSHRNAIKHFQTGNLKDAVKQFELTLHDEPRKWMRRELLGWLVRCALREGDYVTAATRFRSIYSSDKDTRHIALVPVMWTDETIDAITQTTASAWTRDADEIMKLIGASILLNVPTEEKDAEQILRDLSRSIDDNVRMLATWQMRRSRIRLNEIGGSDITSWESRIPRLKPTLRSGPYFLLGQAHLLRKQYELAAGVFLKLPIVYDSNHPITARACLEAARALQTIGQRQQAIWVYQEVVDRYGLSRQSIAARVSLKELTQAATSQKK
jgi:TolA-binding protein